MPNKMEKAPSASEKLKCLLHNSEILVMPTLTMRPGEEAWAVCCAVPTNQKGVRYIYGRQASDTRKLEEGMLDRGNILFGGHEALVVLENVFVPWERVFMYKDHEFAGQLVEKFAAYHRQSYACKVGVGDVLIGASQCLLAYAHLLLCTIQVMPSLLHLQCN